MGASYTAAARSSCLSNGRLHTCPCTPCGRHLWSSFSRLCSASVDAGKLMDRSLIICFVGVALGAPFVLAKPFWPKEQGRGPQAGCSSPEPCTEMKVPSEIAKGSPSEAHTSNHNFSMINLGYEVTAFWRN